MEKGHPWQIEKPFRPSPTLNYLQDLLSQPCFLPHRTDGEKVYFKPRRTDAKVSGVVFHSTILVITKCRYFGNVKYGSRYICMRHKYMDVSQNWNNMESLNILHCHGIFRVG